MYNYENEYELNGISFIGGKITFGCFLGIVINLEDESIIDLIYNNPKKLASCIKNLVPEIIFQEAHRKMHWLANEDGHLHHGSYWNQWEEYFSGKSFKKLEKIKMQAECVLTNERSLPLAIKNAKIVLECLNGNFPERYVKEKSPEEKARAAFERKKPKLRLKLTIRDGYKCDTCSKDTEGSLCIIRKNNESDSYEIDNLLLRCRSCIRKHTNKN
jgi:hypothetical protein